MASTYSPSLRLELIGDGDQSGIWGQTTNNNLGYLIEQSVAGVIAITMTDANYTLSNFNGVVDEARNQVLVMSGALTATRNVIAPLVEKTYIIKNSTSGSQSIQIIGSSGLGVTIPNGVTALVYCDGTNFYNAISGSVGNFTVNGNLSVTGTTSLSGALTYGGVALSNSVTGTGSMALSTSPAFTGTPTAPTAAAGTSTTQIATTAFVLSNGAPTGGLIMWGTGTAPSGWLLCDGTAVNRTTYAALFAVVGTTFGVGDGSTTFNLPNYTNRMPYGTTVGATGGSADAVVVTHTHTATSVVSTGTHQHFISNTDTNGGTTGPTLSSSNSLVYKMGGGGISESYALGGSGTTPTVGLSSSAATGDTVTTTNANAGVSGTNANLPPYLGINFIIKT
jgi:microcystin-dependent protein